MINFELIFKNFKGKVNINTVHKHQDKSIKNVIKINFILSSLVFNDFIFDYYHKLRNIKYKYKDHKISVVFLKNKTTTN